MSLEKKTDGDAIELLASTTQAGAATDNGSTNIYMPGMVNGFAFTLDVTAAATESNDKLDVFVQTKIDATNWLDVVHFTQCDGDGGVLTYVEKICADAAEAGFETGTALGEGEVRNLLGDMWRVRWVTLDPTGSNASFTFSVMACPM
jgi:hypothetical protein